MDLSDYINLAAIIIAPLISVIIGQKLQDRAKKRQDKMEIFKTLMTNRVYGWTVETVHALNVIDVVFADDRKVRAQWKAYYKQLCICNPTNEDLKRNDIEKSKLLETMAESLGYKDKITWETIQNPYLPQGMLASMTQQLKNQSNQQALFEMLISNIPRGLSRSSTENQESGTNV